MDCRYGARLAYGEVRGNHLIPVIGGARGAAKLRYLPTNLSRQEIAGELSVSVNTVSTHLRSIYAKLGANDRSEAVRRARELRLLTTGCAL